MGTEQYPENFKVELPHNDSVPKHSDDLDMASLVKQAERNSIEAITKPLDAEAFKRLFKEASKGSVNTEGILEKVIFKGRSFEPGMDIVSIILETIEELNTSGLNVRLDETTKFNFSNCAMDGVDLSYWTAEMGRVFFIDASLRGANMEDSHFNRSSFQRADLTYARLADTMFEECLLENTTLLDTDMSGAILCVSDEKQKELLFGARFDMEIVRILPSLVQYRVQVPKNYKYSY